MTQFMRSIEIGLCVQTREAMAINSNRLSMALLSHSIESDFEWNTTTPPEFELTVLSTLIYTFRLSIVISISIFLLFQHEYKQ